MKTFVEWFLLIGGLICLLNGLKELSEFKETYLPRKQYSNDWSELFIALVGIVLGSVLLLTGVGALIGIVK